jgi:hypothetical protein
MPPNSETVTDIAERILQEDSAPIIRAGLDGHLPQEALDAAQDLVGAARDVIAVGRQHETDIADIERRRDLLPADGYARLRKDANADAIAKGAEAQRATDQAYERLEDELFKAAMPKFSPEREQLARDEAHLAISVGNSPEAAARDLCMSGNDEAVAALLSPWGDTLLKARGVRDIAKLKRDLRVILKGRIVANPTTPAAQLLRDHLTGLNTARGQVGHSIRKITR